MHEHAFEFQNVNNDDYDINDDNVNNSKNDHKKSTSAAKYLVVDIRLQNSMDMAVKSGLYGLLPSGCVFYILSLT